MTEVTSVQHLKKVTKYIYSGTVLTYKSEAGLLVLELNHFSVWLHLRGNSFTFYPITSSYVTCSGWSVWFNSDLMWKHVCDRKWIFNMFFFRLIYSEGPTGSCSVRLKKLTEELWSDASSFKFPLSFHPQRFISLCFLLLFITEHTPDVHLFGSLWVSWPALKKFLSAHFFICEEINQCLEQNHLEHLVPTNDHNDVTMDTMNTWNCAHSVCVYLNSVSDFNSAVQDKDTLSWQRLESWWCQMLDVVTSSCCSFLMLKSDNWSDSLTCFNVCLYLVIISILLMIIDQKWNCVHIFSHPFSVLAWGNLVKTCVMFDSVSQFRALEEI